MILDIPVYLFTGFLDCGKTSFIQETLQDERFNSGESTLLLVCEEGEEEYDMSAFASKNVTLKTVDEETELTEKNLKQWQKDCKAARVIVEYNGMWLLKSLFSAMPKEWIIYQEMTFAEADSYISYNANMRSLVADKLNGCELIVFNRCKKDVPKEALHKIVRSVNRRADIAYEFCDRHVEYDDIKDPLPYDLNAQTVEIGDSDFGIFYADLMDDAKKYKGKALSFLGIAAKDRKMPRLEFAIGRHIMTCCVEDIQYGGMVAQWENAPEIKSGGWYRVKGTLRLEFNELYGEKGPVLKISEAIPENPPENKVVTLGG